jgi:nitrate reductase gamma subunit
MYELVRGPLVWIGLLGFVGGSLYKLISMGLLAREEKTVFPTMDRKFGLRSVMHWVVPLRTHNMRRHSFFTLVSFAFHLCLLLTPLLVMGHAVLWEDSWGISWWSLPPLLGDVMTLVVIAGGAFFLVRRLAAPEVRNVSSVRDFALLLLVISPFVTGFIAHQQWVPREQMVVAHVICGVAWLLAIPFTRLSHMLWFLFSRAYMGSEFGAVRNARDW